jgi:hypothetical protein
MIDWIASCIMPRTTLNLDAPILRDLKRLQKREGKPLGRLVSDLLARVLRDVRDDERRAPPFRWNAQRLDPRVDLGDKEAIRAILDRDEGSATEATRR